MKHLLILLFATNLVGSISLAGAGGGGGVMDAMNTRSAVFFSGSANDNLVFQYATLEDLASGQFRTLAMSGATAKRLKSNVKSALIRSKAKNTWVPLDSLEANIIQK